MKDNIRLEKIKKTEISTLIGLIKEMAEYEKLSADVSIDKDVLAMEIFEKEHVQVSLITNSGKTIGYCMYLYNFSSFKGRPGLYIEDIYIKPPYRGRGFGKKIFGVLEETAKMEGCARMEWTCLDWNEPAIAFYDKIGGKQKNEWILYRKDLID